MLQINSGKFFKGVTVRRNELKGITYTNLHLLGPVETAAGRLLPVNASMNPNALVFEITELIEGEPRVGALVSHGVAPYLEDFAAIVSIVLNVICTPNYQLISRLTSSRSGVIVGIQPGEYVQRVYDGMFVCKDEDAECLRQFVADLMGLERKNYLAAIRSIKAFTTGLHRLADDLELAYTLLVASIETLVPTSGLPNIEWSDYNEPKRTAIDKALRRADEKTAKMVREAILKHERPSYTELLCDFVLSHLDTTYFRDEAQEAISPIGLLDLRHALRKAYVIRSRYIHALKELPSMLPHRRRDYGEIHRSKDDVYLTLQGLTRLARHVIIEYIRRQPKVETEDYDYSREQHGIMHVPMVDFAPSFWIHGVDDLTVNSGRIRFEGFLSEVVSCLQKEENSTVTDIRDMLSKAVSRFPQMSQSQRRPFLALCILFEHHASIKLSPNGETIIGENYLEEIESPSPEAMLVHLLTDKVPDWTLEQHQAAYKECLVNYGKGTGLKAPPSLVASCALELAERHRATGEVKRARELITSAVGNFPGHEPLYNLERAFDPEVPIRWHEIVFPTRADVAEEEDELPQ